MKKKNTINYEEFEDILFIPRKHNPTPKIILVSLLLFLGLIANIAVLSNYGRLLNILFEFPIEQLTLSDNTNVYCKNRAYPMGGSSEIDDWNYIAMMKTDFVGELKNDFILPAKNVVLGVKINGITNPSTEWWMGKITIDDVPPHNMTSFNKELNHLCSQNDITWSFEIISAEF